MKTYKQNAYKTLMALASGKTINGISCPDMMPPKTIKLLGSSTKVEKSKTVNVLSSVLYLAPSDSSGIKKNGKRINVCPHATSFCRSACLGLVSGRMKFKTNFNARLWKTALFLAMPQVFGNLLIHEIRSKREEAIKKKMICAIRLNGSSDIDFVNRFKLNTLFPDVMFYEYTKTPNRIKGFKKSVNDNYHLTYSANSSSQSKKISELALSKGLSVSAIVEKEDLTNKEIENLLMQVVHDRNLVSNIENGDATDARFLDNKSSLVTLKIKGGKTALQNMGKDVFKV